MAGILNRSKLVVSRRKFIKTGLIWVPSISAYGQLATVPCRRLAFLATDPVLTITAGLLARWEATNITGLNDGDPVSTWPDSSGNSRDATQVTNLRPLFKTNIFGTRPAVRFSGTGSGAARSVFTPAAITSITVFVAWQLKSIDSSFTFGPLRWRDGTTGSGFLTAGEDTSTSDPIKHLVVWNSGGSEVCNKKGPDESLSLPGTPRVKAVDTWRWDGSTCTMRKNGSAQTVGNGTSGYSSGGISNIGIPYNACGGDIACILVYDNALSDGDVTTVETYLNAKYPCF